MEIFIFKIFMVGNALRTATHNNNFKNAWLTRSHVSNNVQMFFMFIDFHVLSSGDKDNEPQ